MDDINFDELDKAVNSALKQTTTPEPPEVAPAAETSEAQVAPTEVKEEPKVEEKPVERVAQQRRGQFMDMVHPSSDMIKQTPARASRQAATIQPLNPSIVEEQQDNVKNEPKQEATVSPETQAEPAAAGVSETEQPSKSEWPDPLDAMEQQESATLPKEESVSAPESEANVTDTSPEENAAPVEKEADSSVESESQESSGSPFIAGTEPEKRPLGAFTDQVPSDEALGKDEAAADETSTEENGTGSELPAVPPVPQELAPEVVSVESDDPSRISSSEDEPDSTAPGEGTGMAASISQQYKNTDEPSDGQDHPVFDTKDYHQPLTPPAKRGHTGLIVTLVIILLALLGAGAWYAIFVLKVI